MTVPRNPTPAELDAAYLDGRILTTHNPYGSPADNLLAWAFDFGRRETEFLTRPTQPTPSWKREVWKKEASAR